MEWVTERAGKLITIRVALADERATGSLEIAHPPAEPTRREFEAATCAEVSSALALVVALALDPNARTDALDEQAPAPAPEPLPLPSASPALQASPTSTATSPQALSAEREASASTRSKSRSVRFFVGPAAGASSGYAPTALVTLGAILGVRSLSEGGFAPSLQLTPLWGKTGSTGPSSTEAVFAWLMLRLDACPTKLKLTAALALVPCGTFEAGQLSARGESEGVDFPSEAQRLWAAAGVSLGLRFTQGEWYAGLGGSALAPFTRDKFVFLEPTEPVHEAEALVYGGLLSVGVSL